MGNCAGMIKRSGDAQEQPIEQKGRPKPKDTPYTRISILGSSQTGKSSFFGYLFPS